MEKPYSIAGYCRISVDIEEDRDNTSIENQKSIISKHVALHFPGSQLVFYTDRDRSGYTFGQREDYQRLRKKLLGGQHDILIVKDFSRFSRRNSRGLVELEDLRDAGVRIISIGENVDFPNDDDWLKIQFQFLLNEMPVTDASKKVRKVVSDRQRDAKWICAVPYGYVITNTKTMAFEVDPPAAQVVRLIYTLYNQGWGYKKIANHLTGLGIPTPRMTQRDRMEAAGEDTKIKARPQWSIVTVQGILANDFYIGTLRQRKYSRGKINGADVKLEADEHIVFENHHPPIVEYRDFAMAQQQREKRGATHYRGVKKYDNDYSGLLFCGDCGSPMFSMSRADLKPAYTCGSYHRRGLKGCTSHHTRVDVLDRLVKSYIRRVRDGSEGMMQALEAAIKAGSQSSAPHQDTLAALDAALDAARDELKATKRQKVREIMRSPHKEELIEETYAEIEAELESKIKGLQTQLSMEADRHNTVVKANRAAKTVIQVFDDILAKPKLDKGDLELIIEKITVYEDHLEIRLKQDIDALLTAEAWQESVAAAATFRQGTEDISLPMAAGAEPFAIVQSSAKHGDKVFRVNVVSKGEPLEIYTDAGGSVIFRKYSPAGELSSLAGHLCDAVYKICGRPLVICDRDSIIAAAGAQKKELDGKPITPELEELMQSRQIQKPQPAAPVTITVPGVETSLVAPIIAGGDLGGCVAFLAWDSPPGEWDIKLAQTAATFLSKQMED